MKLRGGKKSKAATLGRQRRTTTSWEKPSAFSYHANRADRPDANGRNQTSLADQRRRLLSVRFWARRSGLLVAIIVALICLISILSLSNTPRIVLLSNGGSYAFHQSSDYQQAAAKDLSSSIWNRNKITINTGAASTQLRRQFPELASVSITLPLIGHRPIYYLRANSAALVLQAINGTYILDASGKALLTKAAAPAAISDKLPVVTDQTGLHVRLGQQVISSNNATFIRTVLAELSAHQITVASLDLPTGGAQELDVHLTGQPYYVKFNMHNTTGARQQAGTYLATANNLATQHITPAQYIDVRTAGRAYYQ